MEHGLFNCLKKKGYFFVAGACSVVLGAGVLLVLDSEVPDVAGAASVEGAVVAGASIDVDGCAELLVPAAPSSDFLPQPIAANITTPQASKAKDFFISTSILNLSKIS